MKERTKIIDIINFLRNESDPTESLLVDRFGISPEQAELVMETWTAAWGKGDNLLKNLMVTTKQREKRSFAVLDMVKGKEL